VRGPIDVVRNPSAGILNEDLRSAALAALDLDRGAARRYAEMFPWEASCRRFLACLVPARSDRRECVPAACAQPSGRG
jgi:hypothetical protein